MFVDVIREASNPHEIYFLLTSYVEAVRFGDALNVLPDSVKRLPLDGNDQLRRQYQELIRLQNVRGRNVDGGPVIDEALSIFGAALTRLDSLAEPSQRRATEPA
ncbi:MAG TPA: hypothetical protein VFZ14_12025 [Burkholderiales bacterium]|nr:hypothetical protein [Burkholderiales bacterium]